VVARAGVQVETGLVGNVSVPRVTGKSTPLWLANEASQVTASQPTLGQIAMTPKLVGGVVNFTRQLSRQANAEAFVRRELMRTVGSAIDQTVISGPGTSGQPLGLLNTPSVQAQSGASLNHAGVTAMKQKCATVGR
jgi:HK97 family phage major capsid protein